MLRAYLKSLAHTQRISKSMCRQYKHETYQHAQQIENPDTFNQHMDERQRVISCWQEEHRARRQELRYLHLAYGFLRGRMYKEIEAHCYETPWVPEICHYLSCWDELGFEDVSDTISEDVLQDWISGKLERRHFDVETAA